MRLAERDPRPLQLPKVTNHTPETPLIVLLLFCWFRSWLGDKDLVIFVFFFLFGFERWGLGMVICGFVGFFFFFWILSEN